MKCETPNMALLCLLDLIRTGNATYVHFCINNIEANLVGTLLNYSLGCEYELWPNSQPSSHRPGDGGVARDDQDTRGQVHRNTEIL